MPRIQTDATLEPPPSIWEAFHITLFRAVWIAAFVSNIGTWMQNTAGVWLLTTLSTSSVLVAMMQTATSLPVFLLSVPSGVIADLLDRRRLLLVTQAFMAVMALTLAVTTLMGVATAWSTLFLTFMLGVGAAFNAPAWQTIASELVPRRLLPAALTLNGVSMNAARAIGPALGGLIIAYFSPGYVFLLNSLSFLGTCLVLYQWKRPIAESSLPGENFVSALRAGIRYVQFSPAIHAIMIRASAFTFGASALWALLSLVIAQRLHLSSGTYGIMLSCLGTGAVTAALLMNTIQQYLVISQRILVGMIGFALAELALATFTTIYFLYPVMFMAGVSWLLTLTSFNISVQLNLPKWVQARVLSLYLLVFQGGTAFGSLIWGSVASQFGLTTALVSAAGALVIAMLLAIWFPIQQTASLDLAPAGTWDEPDNRAHVAPDDGPVVVMIEYRIDPQTLAAFLQATEALKRVRLRDGALRVGVFTDITQPERQVEFFMVASWADHLRQHQRFTQEDIAVQEMVEQFHIAPTPPKVSHFVAQTDTYSAIPAPLQPPSPTTLESQ
ncbi:MFS transporter [Spirosoma sp. KUDC1026]|uniref:MFS transporter n=1 Tax=Spirosoma sp. KUDC1026 TaxID=2745947 RepID=UPI00159B8991|nr:MFS transporter [Spirosoma sp. KUDC1026]QKZ13910.1 MFS transporter [Spirosoma sp. KUDC1026]